MSEYFQRNNGDLIPKSSNDCAIQVINCVVWVGPYPVSDKFSTEDEARLLQSKIAAKLIEGGDTILIIDDF